MEEYILYLNLFVIFNLIILILALLVSEVATCSNRFLACIFSIPLFTIAFNIGFFYLKVDWLGCLVIPSAGFSYCFGAFLRGYANAVLQKPYQKKEILHFLPFLLSWLHVIWFETLTEKEQSKFVEDVLNGEQWLVNVLNLGILFSAIFYMVTLLIHLKKLKKSIGSEPQWLRRYQIKWVALFVWILIGVDVVFIVSWILPMLLWLKSSSFSDLVVAPIMSLGMYFMVLMLSNQYSNRLHFMQLFHQNEHTQLLKNDQAFRYAFENKKIIDRVFVHSNDVFQKDLRIEDVLVKTSLERGIFEETLLSVYGMDFDSMLNYCRVRKLFEMYPGLKFKSEEAFILALQKVGYSSIGAFQKALFQTTGYRLDRRFYTLRN